MYPGGGRVLFPPPDAVDQSLADIGRAGAAGEQMLGTIDLGRFGKNRGATGGDQSIAGHTECRVGGDTGVGVRAAALRAQYQLRGRNGFATHVVDAGEHFPHAVDGRFDRAGDAAQILNIQRLWTRGGAGTVDLDKLLVIDEVGQGTGFAAQPDQQVTAHVRVAGKPGQHPIELTVILAVVLHGAAALVREREDAVDLRELFLERGVKTFGHVATDRGGTIDRRDHCEIVASAGAAIGSAIALECATGDRRGVRGNLGGEGVVALEVARLQVVGVDPIARRDGFAGKADRLSVLDNRLAGGDRPQGDFVPRWHGAGRRERDGGGFDSGAGREFGYGDGHVVVGVKLDYGGIGRRGHLGTCRSGGTSR